MIECNYFNLHSLEDCQTMCQFFYGSFFYICKTASKHGLIELLIHALIEIFIGNPTPLELASLLMKCLNIGHKVYLCKHPPMMILLGKRSLSFN